MVDTSTVTENQLAYIAGFLDGEGTILMGKYPKLGNRGFAYRGYMAFANTHLPTLEYFQSLMGGCIAEQGRGSRCYGLALTTNAIRRWLPALVPYLRIKREQAEVLLEFLERQAANGVAPRSEELIAFYESCYQRLKVMKEQRFVYRRPIAPVVEKRCACCGAKFMAKVSAVHRLYCDPYCKKQVHWTRHNANVRARHLAKLASLN